MPRRKLYRAGGKITDANKAIALILEGHFFYWADDFVWPKSPKWLADMSLARIATAARHGDLTLAVRNED